MTTIELTAEQQQAVQADRGSPIDLIDLGTKQRYVLIALEQYERVRPLLEQKSRSETAAVLVEVPPGILRSQQAFWRDLPELLRTKKNRGKWVCYHGDERVGIAADDAVLIRECLRRGLPDDAYITTMIRPRNLAPWETEEVEPLGPWHFEYVSPTS